MTASRGLLLQVDAGAAGAKGEPAAVACAWGGSGRLGWEREVAAVLWLVPCLFYMMRRPASDIAHVALWYLEALSRRAGKLWAAVVGFRSC